MTGFQDVKTGEEYYGASVPSVGPAWGRRPAGHARPRCRATAVRAGPARPRLRVAGVPLPQLCLAGRPHRVRALLRAHAGRHARFTLPSQGSVVSEACAARPTRGTHRCWRWPAARIGRLCRQRHRRSGHDAALAASPGLRRPGPMTIASGIRVRAWPQGRRRRHQHAQRRRLAQSAMARPIGRRNPQCHTCPIPSASL